MERRIRQFLDAAAYERGLAPLTRKAYAADLTELLATLRARGRTDWAQVTAADLVAHLGRLRRSGHADASLLRYAAALRVFFAWLLAEGAIPTLPTETLVGGKRPRRLPRTLAEGTLNRLIEAVDGPAPEDLRDRAVLEVLYGCGLRCAELCALRLHDFDDKGGVLRVRGKGGRERIVPHGPPAKRALRAYLLWRNGFALTWKKGAHAADLLAPEAPLFLSPSGRALNRSHLAAIVRARIRAFLPEGTHATPHTLRHAYATHLLNHGAPLMDIRDLLGHASVATTQIYTHVSDAHLRETFENCFPRT